MKVQVLMATMDLKAKNDLPIGLKQLIKTKVKCTVVNQSPATENVVISDQNNIQIFTFSEKGLCKSRNRNLHYLTEKIGLITDQDIRFKKDFQNTIISAFEESPNADIIAFQIEDEQGELLKQYKEEAYWMNQRDIMKVSSVEIAFKAGSINKCKLMFDEDFGLGSTFPTGEEAIFLSDALKKGLKIKYLPIPIVIHPKESSGYQYSNNHSLIQAKGAMLYRIFGPKAYAISFIFAVKKFKISSETLLHFTRLMFDGISSYKKMKHE